MQSDIHRIKRTYVTLTFLSTLASSFIWGINTLFLLDAQLSITQAFAANAFFTAGQVLFEIPTGVVADTLGRRISFLLGTATLFATTLAYLGLWMTTAPFWAWALVSALLGLGFTFFSGATEAWLVDGLDAAGFTGELDNVFAKGSIANGIAMLTGTIAGGVTAQFTDLGVPYAVRAGVLAMTFAVAFVMMHDEGFTPLKDISVLKEMKNVLKGSFDFGLRKAPIRWMMISVIFRGGVMAYAFYAMQPFLLELYGESGTYAVAGIAAAIFAGSQILGGFLVPHAGRIFKRRTSVVIAATAVSVITLLLMGITGNFWVVLMLLVIWSLVLAASGPIRQSYINGLVPSHQRASVLSSDNLLNSAGGVVSQPALGKVADIWGYPISYIGSAVFQLLALPFLLLARRESAPSDPINAPDPKTQNPQTPK